MHNIFSHKELDRRLDRAAHDPAGFPDRALELACELDEGDLDLEIANPLGWRRPAAPEGSARRSDPFQQFRADVDQIVPLGREEEQRLARRIEFARIRLDAARRAAGLDPAPPRLRRPCHDGPLPRPLARRSSELHALRTELVERNLYLVLINVERYAQQGRNRMDLIQEGALSLFRAVDGFDWRRGLLFRTYAVHWLNQAFRNYLYNFNNTVRVPVYLQKALKHVNQAAVQLGDPDATPAEIASHSGLKENLVTAALAAARASFSIDAPYSQGEEGSRLRDVLIVPAGEDGPYDPSFEDLSLEEGMERALGGLNDREERVVRMRYGIGFERPHTLAEVAGVLGVSVERVRQIQVRAIARMNTPGLRRELDPFLN